MSFRMHVIFILFAMFLVPDDLVAARNIEDFFEPDENEKVQANDESVYLEELIEEPISRSLGKYKTKPTCDRYEGKPRSVKAIPYSIPSFPCAPYPTELHQIRGLASQPFIQLYRCAGTTGGSKHECRVTKDGNQSIWIEKPYSNCYIEVKNHTKCERACKNTLPCLSSTFNEATCSCTKKYFV